MGASEFSSGGCGNNLNALTLQESIHPMCIRDTKEECIIAVSLTRIDKSTASIYPDPRERCIGA